MVPNYRPRSPSRVLFLLSCFLQAASILCSHGGRGPSLGVSTLGYNERTYGNQVYDFHVPVGDLADLIASRKALNAYFPSDLDAYTVLNDTYFNIIWETNADSIDWEIVYDNDALMYAANASRLSSYQVSELDSYAPADGDQILYAAVFLPHKTGIVWNRVGLDLSLFQSRSDTFRTLGYKPSSLSVVQDPETGEVTFSDVWTANDIGSWACGLSVTPDELVKAIKEQWEQFALVPVSLQAFRNTTDTGSQVTFSYIMYPGLVSQQPVFTMGSSVSGLSFLMDVIGKPPAVFSAYAANEIDYANVDASESYAAVWNI